MDMRIDETRHDKSPTVIDELRVGIAVTSLAAPTACTRPLRTSSAPRSQ